MNAVCTINQWVEMGDGTVKYRKGMPKNVKLGYKKSLPSLEHKKSKQYDSPFPLR